MTDIPDLIRTALTDIAKEAQPVDLTSQALRGARRRSVKMTVTAAAAVLAMGIATPFALASSRNPVPPANSNPAGTAGIPVTPSPAATPGIPVTPSPAATPGIPVTPSPAATSGVPATPSPAATSGVPATPSPAVSPPAHQGTPVAPSPARSY